MPEATYILPEWYRRSPVFDTAEMVPSTTPLMAMASAFAMRTGVLAGSQQFVGIGKPFNA